MLKKNTECNTLAGCISNKRGKHINPALQGHQYTKYIFMIKQMTTL